jgi:hypothetical protein
MIALFEVQNEGFELLIKMVVMLTYVPPDRVQDVWKKGVNVYAM